MTIDARVLVLQLTIMVEDTRMIDTEEDTLRRELKVLEDTFTTPPQSDSEDEGDLTHKWFKGKTDAVGVKRPLSQPDGSPIPQKQNNHRGSDVSGKAFYAVNHYEASPRPPATPVMGNSAMTSRRASGATSANLSANTSANTSFKDSFRTEDTSVSFAESIPSCGPIQPNGVTDTDTPMIEKEVDGAIDTTEPVCKPGGLVAGLRIDDYLNKSLLAASPFEVLRFKDKEPDFRVIYEVSRVALHADLPPQQLLNSLIDEKKHPATNYSDIWSTLARLIDKYRKRMPERSSQAAWEAAGLPAESCRVALSGNLKYNTAPDGPLFRLELQPLKIEPSYRLKRKYGPHRFFHLGFSGTEPRDLPPFLKSNADDAGDIIRAWIKSSCHELLGRKWKCFYQKDQQASTRKRKETRFEFNEPRAKFFLFAEGGIGIDMPLTTKKMIEWLIDVRKTGNESCLKLFSRVALGLSPTTPTIDFTIGQIVRIDDTKQGSTVMNDGCARISQKAAENIAAKLGLYNQAPPSAFQARIGGAKGVWFVDPRGDKLKGHEIWIEVTPSQLKYDWHEYCLGFEDVLRRTFEVSSWSTPPRSSHLNFQLMPILNNRGVKAEIFELLLERDITDRGSQLEAAMNSGRDLARWNQETNPLGARRKMDGSIDWQGGAPRSLADQIGLMAQSGFTLQAASSMEAGSKHLKDLTQRSFEAYATRLEERMKIGIGRSVYVLVIADPLGVLEENEVHLGFSTSFADPNSQWYGTMVYDRDVLVARLPAALPSDIQKVHAVFKTELARLQDVIVFSTKGSQALADKLSGGDYDGDRVWVCWEPDMVDNFQNAEVPPKPTTEHYGMLKDTTKVRDLGEDPTMKLVQKGLAFSMQPSILGSATGYFERWLYHNWKESGSTALELQETQDLAAMLGYLVDASKAGITFKDCHFKAYLGRMGMKFSFDQPAYKTGSSHRLTNHPIDRTKARGRKVVEKVFKDLSAKMNDTKSYDKTLCTTASSEEELAKGNPVLVPLFDDVKKRLQAIFDHWQRNVPKGDVEFGEAREGAMSFGALVEHARRSFEELAPLDCAHDTARRWKQEHERARTSIGSTWLRFKASLLFRTYHNTNFPWHVCMRELCAIKALASPEPSVAIKEIHDVTKMDIRLVRRLDKREEERMAAFVEALDDDAPEDWLTDEDLMEAFDSMLHLDD